MTPTNGRRTAVLAAVITCVLTAALTWATTLVARVGAIDHLAARQEELVEKIDGLPKDYVPRPELTRALTNIERWLERIDNKLDRQEPKRRATP